jgi:hypothetical protein
MVRYINTLLNMPSNNARRMRAHFVLFTVHKTSRGYRNTTVWSKLLHKKKLLNPLNNAKRKVSLVTRRGGPEVCEKSMPAVVYTIAPKMAVRSLYRTGHTLTVERFLPIGSVRRFEVFTAVTMKKGVFWDVTPCGSCKYRRFGRT